MSKSSLETYEMFNEAEPIAVVNSTPIPSSSLKPAATLVFKRLASSSGPLTTPPTEPIVSENSTSPTTIVAPPVVNVTDLPPVVVSLLLLS